MTTVRRDIEEPTGHIASLKIDPDRGFPVPFFVAWIDGKPDFRLVDPVRRLACIKQRLCWVCGNPLGKLGTFVIGPMCSLNKVSAEPPSHHSCAVYSAKNCPFLTNPNMVRREDETTEQYAGNVAGIAILRNPGVTLLWTTRRFSMFRDGNGGVLFDVGEPVSLAWYAQGRQATRAEVEESIRTGLPILEEMARQEEGAMEELHKRHRAVMLMLPRE